MFPGKVLKSESSNFQKEKRQSGMELKPKEEI
jgi:hypothetical protein